jgi:hypothetical protein
MKMVQSSIADLQAICTIVNNAYRVDSSGKGWTTEADVLDGIRIDESMLEEYCRDDNSTIPKCVSDEGKIIGCIYLKRSRRGFILECLLFPLICKLKG